MSMTTFASAAALSDGRPQLKHLLHVVDVLLAQFHRLRVVLEVVVAIRQAESALIDFGDDLAARS